MISNNLLQYRLDWLVFAALTVGSTLFAQRFARRYDLSGMHSWWNWVWIALLVVAGGLAAEFSGHRERARLEESVMLCASDYACDLERMGHARITPATSSADPGYLDQIAVEKDWLKRNPTIADIYTYRRLPDGRFVYLVYAESGNNQTDRAKDWRKARTPIGSVLPATDELIVQAANGEALIDTSSAPDARGVWARAFQPMFDGNGQVEAVLGANLYARPWLHALFVERLIALVQSYALFVLVLGAVYISRQRNKLSERAQTETKLRESENRFRSLCENTPNIAVQGYDRDRRVIFWNRASELLYGFTRAEALGQLLETLIIPPPMREGVVAAINSWHCTGVPIPAAELELQRKDGSAVSVFSSHVMQLNSRGEPEMYCVDIELTERNRAQAALALSEANYRTLFEVMPHPLWVYDFETCVFLAVNSAAIDHYGYTKEEFLQLKLQDIFFADDLSALTRHINGVPDEGRYGPAEWRHRKKNGEIILVETVSHSLAWTGRRARIVMAQDITTRRAAERRIIQQAELLDKTTEAIVVVDLDQRITFWNRGAERLFCYTATEMRGRTLEEMFTLGNVTDASKLAEALGHVESDWRGEINGIDRNGRSLCIETSIAVIRGDTGQVTGRLSVSTDITKRKALESQIVQAQKMEVLGQLAGGVAHDFNSILMAITLHLDMLEMDLRSNLPAVAMLGDLKTMTERASTLIGQLLLFARKHAMKLETLELNTALNGVAKMLQRLLGAEISLEFRESSAPLWIEGDVAMLDQVVMNLCVNSRDAMPKGGKLTLETSLVHFSTENSRAPVETRQGSFACLRVSDTGCGMKSEVMAHAFEPFFTTKDAGKGTGLGLSTVHGIVHQHQGWLTMESVVGRGTTFLIYLPISSRTVPDTLAAAEASIKGGKETILLVEDDEIVRRSCAAILLKFGYHVLPSADGQSALQTWGKNPGAIDLLLTDMVLPKGMSGLELSEQLLLKRPSLSVVIMSGYNPEIMKADGLLARGFKFIQKPIRAAVLASVIRSCLD